MNLCPSPKPSSFVTRRGHIIPYKRVLLKLSGEILAGSGKFGLSQDACLNTAKVIKALTQQGVEVAIVIGGGNIFRGISLESLGIARSPADQMGMLATMINGIALQEALASIGRSSKVLSAIDCPKIVESYKWANALEYLSEGIPVIFVGGTGNPYFTTDTCAALRAAEIKADILLKATKVNGIYDKDPIKHPDAIKYDTISYGEVLAQKLAVIDATAIAMCQSNHIPVLVFNMSQLNDTQILTLLSQQNIGTLVTPG